MQPVDTPSSLMREAAGERTPRSRGPRTGRVATGFTVREAADMTGVPARSINFWSGPARVVPPDVVHAGRGTTKRFSSSNLVQLRVVYVLTQRWIALETIRALMRTSARFRRVGEDWFSPKTPAEPDRWGALELLTCTGKAEWVLRRPGSAELTEPWRGADSGKGGTGVSGYALSMADLMEGSATHDVGADGPRRRIARQLLEEVEAHDDLLVVNLTRIKASIQPQLGG